MSDFQIGKYFFKILYLGCRQSTLHFSASSSLTPWLQTSLAKRPKFALSALTLSPSPHETRTVSPSQPSSLRRRLSRPGKKMKQRSFLKKICGHISCGISGRCWVEEDHPFQLLWPVLSDTNVQFSDGASGQTPIPSTYFCVPFPLPRPLEGGHKGTHVSHHLT